MNHLGILYGDVSGGLFLRMFWGFWNQIAQEAWHSLGSLSALRARRPSSQSGPRTYCTKASFKGAALGRDAWGLLETIPGCSGWHLDMEAPYTPNRVMDATGSMTNSCQKFKGYPKKPLKHLGRLLIVELLLSAANIVSHVHPDC